VASSRILGEQINLPFFADAASAAQQMVPPSANNRQKAPAAKASGWRGDRCFLKFKWPEDAATGAREDDGGGGMDINGLANGPPGKLCHFYCLNNKTTAAANCFEHLLPSLMLN
jgi:hypothetical protein